ncbi:MAG: helix-turn-helix transcriptional regulator [Pseudomonadota bacterium]
MHSFEEILGEARYRDANAWNTRVGSAQVGVSEMNWPPGRLQNLTAKYTTVVVYRSAACIQHEICGKPRPKRRFAPGDIVVRPSNMECATEFFDPVRLTVLAVENELVRSVTTAFNADVAEVIGRLEARPFRSPLVEGLATQLAACARTGGDRLYADAVSFALLHEIWRLADGGIDAREVKPSTLDAGMLARIDEVVAEAPNGQVSLGSLAKLAGMSISTFTAAMREATGLTPYRYVLNRRLACARHLIETTCAPLADIAIRCGFASQSHMTDVFRSKLGVTPGKLRRSTA